MPNNEVDEGTYANLKVAMAHEICTCHRFYDAVLGWVVLQDFLVAPLGKNLGRLFLEALLI